MGATGMQDMMRTSTMGSACQASSKDFLRRDKLAKASDGQIAAGNLSRGGGACHCDGRHPKGLPVSGRVCQRSADFSTPLLTEICDRVDVHIVGRVVRRKCCGHRLGIQVATCAGTIAAPMGTYMLMQGTPAGSCHPFGMKSDTSLLGRHCAQPVGVRVFGLPQEVAGPLATQWAFDHAGR